MKIFNVREQRGTIFRQNVKILVTDGVFRFVQVVEPTACLSLILPCTCLCSIWLSNLAWAIKMFYWSNIIWGRITDISQSQTSPKSTGKVQMLNNKLFLKENWQWSPWQLLPFVCASSRVRTNETSTSGSFEHVVYTLHNCPQFKVSDYLVPIETTWLNHVTSDTRQFDHFLKKLVRTPQDKIPTQHISPPYSHPENPLLIFILSIPNPLLKGIKLACVWHHMVLSRSVNEPLTEYLLCRIPGPAELLHLLLRFHVGGRHKRHQRPQVQRQRRGHLWWLLVGVRPETEIWLMRLHTDRWLVCNYAESLIKARFNDA